VASLTKAHVVKMMSILDGDRRGMLLRLDAYNRGIHDDPWMPDNADREYQMLAERSKTNIIPFLINTPAQALYVDQFRRGSSGTSEATTSDVSAVQPEWEHWEQSNLGSRQHAVYRGALGFGHSFTVTAFDAQKRLKTRGLSPLRTTALFADPANDIVPVHSLTITKWPSGEGDKITPGTAIAWDEDTEYAVTFKGLGVSEGLTVKKAGKHGANENPVTRFVAFVDLEGRTTGVVEPMLDLQNRLNQTVFDLLVVQSYASFKVRTVTGMAPPVKMVPVYEGGDIVGWEPQIDENTGKMIPDQVNINARRWMWAEDENVKFGTLDETPLDGFISAIDLAFRHIAALGQVPPHHLLGQIANLSAEALVAAETALERKVQEFKSSFGESWERVFRLAMAMLGEQGADDFTAEVIWRDMEQRSLAQAGDALGKLRESLGIPARGLWARVPGATATELRRWEELADEEEPSTVLARSLQNASTDNAVTSIRDEGEAA